MNINIYGSKKFTQSMDNLLLKLNIDYEINHIKSVKDLEKTIQEYKDDIFLIDSEKIISTNMITQINFLKPKDKIYKEVLEDYGIDDLCFNSNEALLKYINDKIVIHNRCDNEDIKMDNLDEITKLDDINESSLLRAINNSNSSTSQIKKLEINSENIEDISKLLEQLVKYKNIELILKLKD